MRDDEALVALTTLLSLPRQVFLAITSRHADWKPSPGSVAATELASVPFPVPPMESLTGEKRKAGRFPEPGDNPYLVNHPRSVASLHVRVGADYLAGEGAVLRSGELMLAPLALARVAFEHSVRAVTLLDPRIGQKERCARAMLEDVVSAHLERVAWKHLVGAGNKTYEAKNTIYRALRKQTERCFEVDFSAGNPHDWQIGGETYLRPVAAAEAWGELLKNPMPAEGAYDVLSLYIHPQSFPSRGEARFDAASGESRFEADPDLLRWATTWAISCWIDAARLLFDYYQGWDVGDELDELAKAAGDIAEFER